MALFLLAYVPARLRGRAWARDHGFHAFVIVYGAQRFLWEFLKPYPKLIGPFNPST
jgi:prolipoprotein diacylglyceryltransferase